MLTSVSVRGVKQEGRVKVCLAGAPRGECGDVGEEGGGGQGCWRRQRSRSRVRLPTLTGHPRRTPPEDFLQP